MFDIIRYLESRGVEYWTEGKNVSRGWVNIQCVYPGCDDHSNHLGTNLNTGLHSCWKCGKKGGPEQLVMRIERCEYGEAREIVDKFSDGTEPTKARQPRTTRTATGSFILPKFATDELPNPHYNYLVDRHFDPAQIQRDYGIMACHTVGKYRHRIIIPVFINGTLINYTSRDITGLADNKYKMAPNSEALMTGEEVLYNLDRAGRIVALVEGPLDVWRIGPGAVAVLGTNLTEEKLSLLPKNGIERAFVVYDQDAFDRGNELAYKVSKLVRHTETIWLPDGDPDEYFYKNQNDLNELRYLLAT